MNKAMKLVSVLLMVVMMTTVFSTVCLAGGDTTLSPESIKGKGQAVATEDIQKVGGTIFKTIRNIAAILLVVLIAILGVKFMMGSTEEKAEYKKSFIPLIVGVALVLAATTLAGFIWDTFNNIDSEASYEIIKVAKL